MSQRNSRLELDSIVGACKVLSSYYEWKAGNWWRVLCEKVMRADIS